MSWARFLKRADKRVYQRKENQTRILEGYNEKVNDEIEERLRLDKEIAEWNELYDDILMMDDRDHDPWFERRSEDVILEPAPDPYDDDYYGPDDGFYHLSDSREFYRDALDMS